METHPRVVVALLGWWCGWPVMVVRSHGVGWVDASGLRDKRLFMLVHCWVSGAAHVVPVGPLRESVTWLWLVVCGGCVV